MLSNTLAICSEILTELSEDTVVSELNNIHVTICGCFEFCLAISLTHFLSMSIFWPQIMPTCSVVQNTPTQTQGSVATRLQCGRIFDDTMFEIYYIECWRNNFGIVKLTRCSVRHIHVCSRSKSNFLIVIGCRKGCNGRIAKTTLEVTESHWFRCLVGHVSFY